MHILYNFEEPTSHNARAWGLDTILCVKILTQALALAWHGAGPVALSDSIVTSDRTGAPDTPWIKGCCSKHSKIALYFFKPVTGYTWTREGVAVNALNCITNTVCSSMLRERIAT